MLSSCPGFAPSSILIGFWLYEYRVVVRREVQAFVSPYYSILSPFFRFFASPLSSLVGICKRFETNFLNYNQALSLQSELVIHQLERKRETDQSHSTLNNSLVEPKSIRAFIHRYPSTQRYAPKWGYHHYHGKLFLLL